MFPESHIFFLFLYVVRISSHHFLERYKLGPRENIKHDKLFGVCEQLAGI